MSEIEVGVTLQQLDADLSRIFEDDQDSAGDVRVPAPRPPSEDSARPHLQLAPCAMPEIVIESVRGSLGLPAKVARSPWTTDLPTASVAALVVGFAAHMPASLALGVLAVWAPSAFRAGSALNTPGTPVWRGLAAALSPPVAAAGLAVAVLGTPSRTVAVATLMVLVATMSVLILRSLRVTRPIRAVVLGDGIGIAEATARWQGHGQVKIVGACSAERSLGQSAAR